MKPVFDESGLAIASGDIRVFYFDGESGEYQGWSDEFINIGVSLPGNSTDIDPGDKVDGEVSVFTGTGWEQYADHRGDTVYSTVDGSSMAVDYIGDIRDGFTTLARLTPYDIWNGSGWVTDTAAQHAADVEVAEQQKTALLLEARATISLWQTELQLGSISDDDKASLIQWLAYIKLIQAIDTTTAPEINWPEPLEV